MERIPNPSSTDGRWSFVVAMKAFFGLKEGETLPQFTAEIKALTPKDRDDFKAMLATVGYEVV